MWAMNIPLSGQNYAKMAMFAKCMRQRPVNSSTFDRIQANYVNPVATVYWEHKLAATHAELGDTPLVVSGEFYCAICRYTGLALWLVL